MKITEGHMVIFKAALYALVALLSPLVSLLVTAADANTSDWPSRLKFTAALGTGIIAALVALRAYFDGSQTRWEQNKNGTFKASPDSPTVTPAALSPAPTAESTKGA